MPEQQLNHYAVMRFTAAYWSLAGKDRQSFLESFGAALPGLADRAYLYSIFPTRADADLIVWCACENADESTTAEFFTRFARAASTWRRCLQPVNTLWGFTRPSTYAKGKSPQQLDPLTGERRPYLVVYPFSKTSEWYLLSQDVRQGMMNEHIRVGKKYPQITQLLLYCTGLADQEFVVVYETDELPQFSELVRDLRSTDGRPYTLRDTPIYTCVYRPLEELLKIWA